MKQEIKKFLNHHKGKELTSDLINIISNLFEDEIGYLLYNDGLCFESIDNGNNIHYGDCNKDYMNWRVSNGWGNTREFKTLKGAIRYANQY